MVAPPLEITKDNRPYQPYGSALSLFKSREDEILLAGPAGTGKSRACLEKIHLAMEKYRGARALIVRQTRASLTDTGLVTYEDHVLPAGSKIKSGPSREQRHIYRYPRGSEIVIGGLGSPDDITKIMSSEYDIIFVQEAIEVSEDHWEMLTTRLRSTVMPYNQIIADTNPGAPTHWLKKRESRGSIRILPTTHEENPVFFDHRTGEWTEVGQRYLGRLDKLTGHRLDRMRHGRWVTAEGSRFKQLVDKHYSEGGHRFKFENEWPGGLPSAFNKLIGIDYGLRAPYCCLWIAIDFDRNPWVFREDYKKGLTADRQGQEIVKLTRDNEIIQYAYADPACWSKRKTQEGTIQKSDAEYYQAAFELDTEERRQEKLKPRFGPLIHGYNESRRIAFGTIDGLLNHGNGFPDIRIEEGCTNLWDELTGAVWDSRGQLDTKEDIDPSCPDHAITALYYALHTYYDAPSLPEKDLERVTLEDMMAAKVAKENEDARRGFGKRRNF